MSVEKEQFDKVMGELRRACMPAGGADVVQAYVDSLASDLARVETERRHDLQIQSAMAADQKAVAAALGIPPGEYSGGAGEQLLAIEKLREALARVEASAATLATAGRGAWNRSNATQAQLAEAVGLLKAIQGCDASITDAQANLIDSNIDAFLARHAQAEQQEAQGAQAGDDVIKLFERIISQSPTGLDKATEDNPWYQVMGSEVRAFAAALATQPAEYPAGAVENGRTLMSRLEQWYTFADDQGHALAMCKEWLDLKECFEHMADALSAARGADHA